MSPRSTSHYSSNYKSSSKLSINTTYCLSANVSIATFLSLLIDDFVCGAHDHRLYHLTSAFISTLRSPINTLVAFVVKAGVDFHSQCASSRNAIDLNFFAQVGLQLDFNVHVDANVGVGIGAGHGHGSGSVVSAGAHVGIGAGTSQGQSILSRFQSLSNNFQGQIPAFETASKSKNINEIKSGLDQIHSSFTELGNECGSGLHADLAVRLIAGLFYLDRQLN